VYIAVELSRRVARAPFEARVTVNAGILLLRLLLSRSVCGEEKYRRRGEREDGESRRGGSRAGPRRSSARGVELGSNKLGANELGASLVLTFVLLVHRRDLLM